MSGPKSYSPPPQYSMSVFNGKLNKIFQLQTRLKILYSEIRGLHLSDSKLNIYFDCNKELDIIRKTINDALTPYVFEYKGTFGQEVYNKIDKEIDLRISRLNEVIHKCNLIKTDFVKKQDDYNSYCSYIVFHNNTKISFEEFKRRVINYLKTNIEEDSPDIFKEANTKISVIKFDKEKTSFEFGFNSVYDVEKQAVINHLNEKEEQIHNIRAEISNKIIDKFQNNKEKIKIPKTLDVQTDEVNIVLKKIETLIWNCDDPTIKQKYTDDLEKLKKSESLKDVYFFKVLHDSILENETLRKAKKEIKNILLKLNSNTFHSKVMSEKQNLVNMCLTFLSNSTIRKNELDYVNFTFEKLVNESKKYIEADEIKNKERLFLKSQLITLLKNRGYEVMDDLKVIDFEKENDFFLKVKEQDNYINLKFNNDGSFHYVFQILEKTEDLTTDKQNMKLHEMRISCDEFKSVLNDLNKMGLKLNLKKELPIKLDSIVTISDRNKSKLLKTSQKKQTKKQLKKNYLN